MKIKTLTSILAVSALAAVIPFTLNAQRPERPARGERPAVQDSGDFLPGGPEGGRGRDRGPRAGGPQGGPAGPQHDKLIAFWENENLSAELALSEEQVALLEESLTGAKTALDGQMENLNQEMDTLKELLDNDSPDLDDVYAQIDEVSVLKTDIAKIMAGHRVAVKNILTAEQEDVLKENVRGHLRDRMGERIEGIRDRRQERVQRGEGPSSDLPALEDGKAGPGKNGGDRPLKQRSQERNRS